jgi:hypothetical protein
MGYLPRLWRVAHLLVLRMIRWKTMTIRYYIGRILRDKIKLPVIIFLLLIPSLEVLQIWKDIILYHFEKPNPNFATFLSSYTIGHVLHRIYLWFLPLYLLLITSEDSIEDYDTGYRNILLTKTDKSGYFKKKLQGSFLLSFVVIFCGLMLNLILIYVCYHGGTEMRVIDPLLTEFPREDFLRNIYYTFSGNHPFMTNIIFIIATAILGGAISMVGTAFAIVLHDRKIVYAVTVLVWFIPLLMKNSLMLAIQPFSEYGLDTILPTWFSVLIEYALLILAARIWEVKVAKV